MLLVKLAYHRVSALEPHELARVVALLAGSGSGASTACLAATLWVLGAKGYPRNLAPLGDAGAVEVLVALLQKHGARGTDHCRGRERGGGDDVLLWVLAALWMLLDCDANAARMLALGEGIEVCAHAVRTSHARVRVRQGAQGACVRMR